MNVETLKEMVHLNLLVLDSRNEKVEDDTMSKYKTFTRSQNDVTNFQNKLRNENFNFPIKPQTTIRTTPIHKLQALSTYSQTLARNQAVLCFGGFAPGAKIT